MEETNDDKRRSPQAKERESIQDQIRLGEYRSLAEIILDDVGTSFQKITRSKKPLSYVNSGIVIALVVILISLLVSLVANEFHTWAKLDVAWIALWGILMGFVSTVGFYKVIQHFFETLSKTVLDAIESVSDLEDLQNWFVSTTETRRQILFSLCFTIFMTVFFFSVIWKNLGPQYPRFGFSFIAVLSFFQVGLPVSYFLPLLNFHSRLSRYKLKLFTPNPASSEMVEQLSYTLNQITLLVPPS